jgi:predicted transcriptional regulator
LKSKIDKKLVRKLVEKGLNQTDIAKAFGVSKMLISHVFEEGEYKRLRAGFVEKVIHTVSIQK